MPYKYDGFQCLSDISEYGFKNYTINSLFPNFKPYEYSRNRLLLGWDRGGHPIYLNTSTSKIVLITGKRGSGKTMLMRAMMGRVFLSGHIPVILTDIKGEYRSSKKPVQKKFWYLLDPSEKPIGLPIKSYFPSFLKNYTPSAQSDDTLCQLSLGMINIFDLMTIIDYDETTSSPKKELLMRAFRRIEEREIFTVNELIDEIYNDEEGNAKTKESVAASISTAVQEGVLGDMYSDFSFTDDVMSRHIPVLNLSGYEKMGGKIGYPAAFVSVMARDVIDSKKAGMIDRGVKIFYFIDEAHRWMPASGEPSSKRTLVTIAREERSTGVFIIAATQTVGSLPEDIRKQASIILFPWNIDAPTVIGIMKEIGLYERYGRFADNLNKNLQTLNQYEWVLVDADNRDIKIISKISGPCSYHEEES